MSFGWLVNIVLLAESSWTMVVAVHLMADPTMIVLANSKESALLGIISVTVLISDLLALFFVDVELARLAIMVQTVLTSGATALVFLPTAAPVKVPKAIITSPSVEIPAKSTLRLRKKSSNRITF